MYYVRNLEDDKLELHFQKPEYLSMNTTDKTFVKRNFNFARSISAWRSKRILSNIWYWQTLKDMGFEDQGSTGEKLLFAEKVERVQQRAAERAEYMEEKKTKNEQLSAEHYNNAKKISSNIPMGQPILVGHHSEKRHRKDLEKIDNYMRKNIEASNKADYYNGRYEAAIATAQGSKYTRPGYLVNRINECETNIRQLLRYQQGKTYTYSQAKPVSNETFQYYQKKIEEEQEKLDYFKYCLERVKGNRKVWDKESLGNMKYVKIKGRWCKLLRCNPKTVSVQSQFSVFHLKYNYGEIQDAVISIEEAPTPTSNVDKTQ